MEEMEKIENFPPEADPPLAEKKKPEAQTEILENWEAKTEEEKNAVNVVSLLNEHGVAYFAGGYVRDLLINREFGEKFLSKDIDIATDLSPQEIKKILEKHGFKTKLSGKTFAVIKAFREGDEGEAIDIATFRKEEKYADGRHPDNVVLIRDPEKDAERRDFTVNALFFEPVTKKIIDFVGGIDDLENKVLRPVGDPRRRFQEDYVRMLRYVRFRNKYGFTFSREVRDIIRDNADKILSKPSEKLFQELDLIMKLDKNYMAVADMARLGLLKHLMPEADELRGVMHPKEAPYHKEGTVFRHTLEALRSFSRKEGVAKIREVLDLEDSIKTEEVIKRFYEKYGTEVSWAVLFHDLGKRTKKSTRELPSGEIRTTFVGHELDSRDMAGKIADRLRFSNAKKEKILWLVENHLLPRDLPVMKQSKRRAMLQHPWIEELLFVALADELGNFPSSTQDFEAAYKLLKEERARIPEPKELVSGKELMAKFNLKPGPMIGKLKSAIREAQLEDKIKTPEEALRFAEENLKHLA